MTSTAQIARMLTAAEQDARPAATERYTAWRISPDSPRAECQPCNMGNPATLREAINDALTGAAFQHKDTLALLITDTVSGKQIVHFYAIRQDTKAPYIFDKEKGRAVKAKRYYPDPIFSMAVSEFSPVEPWRWTPGADVVGHDRNMIEGKSQ